VYSPAMFTVMQIVSIAAQAAVLWGVIVVGALAGGLDGAICTAIGGVAGIVLTQMRR
jgi:hypothetical protein